MDFEEPYASFSGVFFFFLQDQISPFSAQTSLYEKDNCLSYLGLEVLLSKLPGSEKIWQRPCSASQKEIKQLTATVSKTE